MTDSGGTSSNEDVLSLAVSEEMSPDTDSNSDSEVDIDALLRAAEVSLASKDPQAIKKRKAKAFKGTALIQKRDGVFKVNPDVLLEQNSKQAAAISKEKAKQVGSDWFDFKTPEMTDKIKRDLQVLKMRSVLDPKRHYRKENTKTNQLAKSFQMGRIIGGSTESAAHKIRRKDQKETIVQDLLADMASRERFKRKTAEIDAKKRSGGRAFYKGIKDRRGSKFSKKG